MLHDGKHWFVFQTDTEARMSDGEIIPISETYRIRRGKKTLIVDVSQIKEVVK